MKVLRNCNFSPLVFEQKTIVQSCFKNAPFRVEGLKVSIHYKNLKKENINKGTSYLDLPVSLDRSYSFTCVSSFVLSFVSFVRSFVCSFACSCSLGRSFARSFVRSFVRWSVS